MYARRYLREASERIRSRKNTDDVLMARFNQSCRHYETQLEEARQKQDEAQSYIDICTRHRAERLRKIANLDPAPEPAEVRQAQQNLEMLQQRVKRRREQEEEYGVHEPQRYQPDFGVNGPNFNFKSETTKKTVKSSKKSSKKSAKCATKCATKCPERRTVRNPLTGRQIILGGNTHKNVLKKLL